MNGTFRENMKAIILLSSIALVSAASVSVSPSPRSVNVALETSFLFEPKDRNDNIAVIKNIKVFLDKLYKMLSFQTPAPPTPQFRSNSNERSNTFLDFMKNVGESIIHYTSDKIKKTVEVVDVEVTEIDNKTGIDIFKEHVFKNVLKNWKKSNAENLRRNIKGIMNEKNPLLHSFARKMNDYYHEDDIIKMNEYLKKFNSYYGNEEEAFKVIKELLQFSIVDKYKKLNETAKANLLKDMKLLSQYISSNKQFRIKMQKFNEKAVTKDNNKHKNKTNIPETIQLLEGTVNVLEQPNDQEADQMYKEVKKSIQKKLKRAKLKDSNKKGAAVNKIVVDKVDLRLDYNADS